MSSKMKDLFILMNEFEQESHETLIWTLNRLVPIEFHYMNKNAGMFSSKTLISFRLKKERRGHG